VKEAPAKRAAAEKAPARKAAAEKAVPEKAAARKAAAQKAAAGEVVAEKAAAPGTVPEKAAAKKAAPGKEAAVTSTVAKKAAAKKTAAKKTAAKKADASKAAEEAAEKAVPARAAGKTGRKGAVAKGGTKKSTPTKSAAKKSTAKKASEIEAAKQTGATTVVAKKTPGTATAETGPTAVPKARIAAAEPGELAVRPGEDPWTPEEVAEARAELQSESIRLRGEIDASEQALVGLMRDSGDGAGDDQADTGTKNITREHEMALAHNAREMLEQTERALHRLDAGTYGLCESCGNPIGKARMQAFPRATLCVECKQKQERR
jgi:RNA polymerase-binding protein DksA